MAAVSRLYEQGISIKQIERRKLCSAQKATKILITTGQYSTPQTKQIAKLRAEGLSTKEIAQQLNMAPKSVSARSPYVKGLYLTDYPTKNALAVRKCRRAKYKKKIKQELEL